MALRRSTGLRNALAAKEAVPVALVGGDDIALVDGGGSADTITRVAADFVTAGFEAGYNVFVYGATDTNDNIMTAGTIITTVAADTLTLPTGTWTTGETAGADIAITSCKGGSAKDLFKDGVIRIYSGSQPTDADSAETGTMLVEITVSDGAFVAGAAANGLEFGTATAGVLAISSETWQGTAAATGTAGWFRFYDNSYTTGASTTAVRFDGACGSSGAQLNMSSTSIASGATVTIDAFNITFPSGA